jgi:hypothetical protein
LRPDDFRLDERLRELDTFAAFISRKYSSTAPGLDLRDETDFFLRTCTPPGDDGERTRPLDTLEAGLSTTLNRVNAGLEDERGDDDLERWRDGDLDFSAMRCGFLEGRVADPVYLRINAFASCNVGILSR